MKKEILYLNRYNRFMGYDIKYLTQFDSCCLVWFSSHHLLYFARE
jgi:hypothetical protein